MSSFHNLGSLSISVMRWWSAAFLGEVGCLTVVFLLGLAGTRVAEVLALFFVGLFVAVGTVATLSDVPRSSVSNNATRSAFFPVVWSPRFFSSSFNSATFRDDQSFEMLFVSFFLFFEGDSLAGGAGDLRSSDSGKISFDADEERFLRLNRGELRRLMSMGAFGFVDNLDNVDRLNSISAGRKLPSRTKFLLVRSAVDEKASQRRTPLLK